MPEIRNFESRIAKKDPVWHPFFENLVSFEKNENNYFISYSISIRTHNNFLRK